MCPERLKTSKTPKGPRGPAFTLVELLLVISILVVLASIMLPAVSAAKNSAYRVKSQQRVNELDHGTRQYYQNNKYVYPGQNNWYTWAKLSSGICYTPYTGSQVLAASLFNPKGYAGLTDPVYSDSNMAQAIYAPLIKGDLFTFQTNQAGGTSGITQLGDGDSCRPWTISDRFNKPLAICYYPSIFMGSGLTITQVTQYYLPGINAGYTEANGIGIRTAEFVYNGTNFPNSGVPPYNTDGYATWIWGSNGNPINSNYGGTEYIVNTAFDPNYNTPYRSNEFLLFGPGPDRVYGNRLPGDANYPVDDVRNW